MSIVGSIANDRAINNAIKSVRKVKSRYRQDPVALKALDEAIEEIKYWIGDE